jgi:hypothetical protein
MTGCRAMSPDVLHTMPALSQLPNDSCEVPYDSLSLATVVLIRLKQRIKSVLNCDRTAKESNTRQEKICGNRLHLTCHNQVRSERC